MRSNVALESGRIILQPEDGLDAVESLIGAASRSIRIKMFTFTAPRLLAAVEAAHGRGVLVKVMLNPRRSSGSRANDETFERLAAAGIEVRWTSQRFAVTHEKSMVLDDSQALVATFNFVDKYFTNTRDYGLVTQDPAVVSEMAACFEADWIEGEFALVPGSALAWSNQDMRARVCHFIDAACDELLIQHPKLTDLAVLDRLLEARKRGVRVHMLCGGRHGLAGTDLLDTLASLNMMRRRHASVRRQKGLRLHAKLLLADRSLALLGSANLDRSAFDLRRELSVTVSDPSVIKALHATFKADWKAAHRYDPPDPLDSQAHEAAERSPDSEPDTAGAGVEHE